MDYVLYTSNAKYWDRVRQMYTPPQVERVYYKCAANTCVMDDVFGPNDCFTSLAFWLGFDAENI